MRVLVCVGYWQWINLTVFLHFAHLKLEFGQVQDLTKQHSTKQLHLKIHKVAVLELLIMSCDPNQEK